MNEEVFNLDLRKFLKRFGVTAQREIERAVAKAIETRAITDKDGPFPITMTLRSAALGIDETFDGDIELHRARD